MAHKKFTWRQLKKFINKLPENELKTEVFWWGDYETGGKIIAARQLQQDYVVTEDGCEPASKHGKKYPIAYKKGTPLFDL